MMRTSAISVCGKMLLNAQKLLFKLRAAQPLGISANQLPAERSAPGIAALDLKALYDISRVDGDFQRALVMDGDRAGSGAIERSAGGHGPFVVRRPYVDGISRILTPSGQTS
jgi:hypothetical protein